MRNLIQPIGIAICTILRIPAALPETPVQPFAMEPIVVSEEGPRFATANSHQPFTPFGGIYYDPATYDAKPFPRFRIITGFDPERTGEQFRRISELGANIIRLSLSTAVFSPEYRKLDAAAFEKLDRMLDLAQATGLRVVLDLLVEWEGQAGWSQPAWERFTDEKILSGMEFLYAAFGERYRDNPAVFSYLVCDEARVPWDSNGVRRAWNEWVTRTYGTQEALREAWDDFPMEEENWSELLPPPDENVPGSPRLYDYQRFREDLATRFVKRLSTALRSRDDRHLVSAGCLQWNVPLRVESLLPEELKPSSYPAFYARKIAPHLDYLHVNCYNWWDSRTPEFAAALGRYFQVAGKPVVLGEFSFDPAVIAGTRGVFSGFFCWAFYPLPTEPVHHYLFDESGVPTSHAPEFTRMAREIAEGTPFPPEPARGTVPISATQGLTDIPSCSAVYAEYMEKSRLRPMELKMRE